MLEPLLLHLYADPRLTISTGFWDIGFYSWKISSICGRLFHSRCIFDWYLCRFLSQNLQCILRCWSFIGMLHMWFQLFCSLYCSEDSTYFVKRFGNDSHVPRIVLYLFVFPWFFIICFELFCTLFISPSFFYRSTWNWKYREMSAIYMELYYNYRISDKIILTPLL